MGFSIVKIGCVAFGVLELILVTVCCAISSWTVMIFTEPTSGITLLIQFGLWKVCSGDLGHQVCLEYGSLASSASELQAMQAMTVTGCLLTYLSVLVLLILGFGANFIPFLKNEETKPKIRLAVGVGLLLAGILLIISVGWFPHGIKEGLQNYQNQYGTEPFSGAGIYVGWVAGVLLLLGGGLLCFFWKKDIP